MNNTKIAGLNTVEDWKKLLIELNHGHNSILNWEKAYSEFLYKRIVTRYFEPIDAITSIENKFGKGFSIVTIYCSLIEFFECLKKGYEFIYPNYIDIQGQIVKSSVNMDNKGVLKPLRNKEVFVNFLTENPPFNTSFTHNIASDFYESVRSSILHKAETGPNWLIKEGSIIDTIVTQNVAQKFCLNWMPLKISFNTYLNNYKTLLLNDFNIQSNFIFKWNKICNIP